MIRQDNNPLLRRYKGLVTRRNITYEHDRPNLDFKKENGIIVARLPLIMRFNDLPVPSVFDQLLMNATSDMTRKGFSYFAACLAVKKPRVSGKNSGLPLGDT